MNQALKMKGRAQAVGQFVEIDDKDEGVVVSNKDVN